MLRNIPVTLFALKIELLSPQVIITVSMQLIKRQKYSKNNLLTFLLDIHTMTLIHFDQTKHVYFYKHLFNKIGLLNLTFTRKSFIKSFF